MLKQKDNVKYRLNINKENILQLKQQLCKEHFVECYNTIIKSRNNLSEEEITTLIRTHKKYIHELNLYGKNKYKTVTMLQNYANNKNKILAQYLLTNTVNNMRLREPMVPL